MVQLRSFNGEVLDGAFRVNGKEVKVLANRNPENYHWGELDIIRMYWFLP